MILIFLSVLFFIKLLVFKKEFVKFQKKLLNQIYQNQIIQYYFLQFIKKNNFYSGQIKIEKLGENVVKLKVNMLFKLESLKFV